MKNKYFSILQEKTDTCFICGKPATEWHHIFNSFNKGISEKYGLMVHLCHNCHNEPPDGLHFNSKRMKALQREAQEALAVREDWTTSEDIINTFGYNLLPVCDRCGSIVEVSNYGSYDYGDYYLCDCCRGDLFGK